MRRRTWPKTLRGLAVGLSSAVLAAALLFLALSLWASVALHAATDDVIRHNRSLSATNDMERLLFLSQRLGNLYVATREQEVLASRDQVWRDLERQLNETAALATTADERAFVERVEQGILRYVAKRREIEARDVEVGDVIRETYASLTSASEGLEELSALNQARVQRASQQVSQIEGISEALPIAASLLMIALLVIASTIIRREIVSPIFELHDAVNRFRNGETAVRVELRGLQEICELSQAYNELAEVLTEQRKTQVEFLAAVAHDLRNPLSGIRLAAQTLSLSAVDERQSRTVELLLRQLDRLIRLIHDLSAVTLGDAGKLDMVREEVDLEEVVRDVVEIYGPTTTRHRITTQLQTPGLTVSGDRVRLEQVLSNLLSNAIKYSPAGGEIVIAGRMDDGQAVLSVTDQGIGIEPNRLAGAFEPFQRLHTTVAPGAGLGLTVVRQIVAAHGGSIRASSKPGAGTTFEIVLPRSAHAS